MSGAYCKNPAANWAFEGKTPDDFPCIFNPWGSADMSSAQQVVVVGATGGEGTVDLEGGGAAKNEPYFDWGKAFPSTVHTAGTVFLFLICFGFAAVVIVLDAKADEVLALMLIWTGLQFVPYIAALVILNGPNPIKGLFLNLVYRPDLPPVGLNAAPWAVRSANAQKENTTALTIFAPAVLLFFMKHPTLTDDIKIAAWGFLIFRVVHYVMLVGPIGGPQPFSGFPTIAFLGSMGCSLYILFLGLLE